MYSRICLGPGASAHWFQPHPARCYGIVTFPQLNCVCVFISAFVVRGVTAALRVVGKPIHTDCDRNFHRVLVCCCLPVIMWFLFGEVFSSSGCLGWATLFYCGTP